MPGFDVSQPEGRESKVGRDPDERYEKRRDAMIPSTCFDEPSPGDEDERAGEFCRGAPGDAALRSRDRRPFELLM